MNALREMVLWGKPDGKPWQELGRHVNSDVLFRQLLRWLDLEAGRRTGQILFEGQHPDTVPLHPRVLASPGEPNDPAPAYAGWLQSFAGHWAKVCEGPDVQSLWDELNRAGYGPDGRALCKGGCILPLGEHPDSQVSVN